jgi:hypothetical protein
VKRQTMAVVAAVRVATQAEHLAIHHRPITQSSIQILVSQRAQLDLGLVSQLPRLAV